MTDGYLIVFRPDSGYELNKMREAPTLALIQDKLGGDVKQVPSFFDISLSGQLYRCAAFSRAESRLLDTPTNGRATDLWRRSLARRGQSLTDFLVGPIAVIAGDLDFLGEF